MLSHRACPDETAKDLSVVPRGLSHLYQDTKTTLSLLKVVLKRLKRKAIYILLST